MLNFPIITTTSYADGEVIIDYELDVPAGDYRIEFFENSVIDPSGYGEGEQQRHTETITHTGGGAETFNTIFAMTETEYITATCTKVLLTGGYGSTSEFSLVVPTTWVSNNDAGVDSGIDSSSDDHIVVVTTTSDVSDGDTRSISELIADNGADGLISLREAILAANSTVNNSRSLMALPHFIICREACSSPESGNNYAQLKDG